MSAILSCRQGESSPTITFSRNGESLDGWTCLLELRRFKSDSSGIVSRLVTAVGLEWPTFLTQAETAALDVGHHVILGKLVKAATDEEEVKEVAIHISEAWL